MPRGRPKRRKANRKADKPMMVPEPTGTALVAIDNPWKSHSYYQDPHCHTWQRGSHIDTLANDKPRP